MSFTHDFVLDGPFKLLPDRKPILRSGKDAKRARHQEAPPRDDPEETSDVVWSLAYWSWL